MRELHPRWKEPPKVVACADREAMHCAGPAAGDPQRELDDLPRLGGSPQQQRCAQAYAETKGFDLHVTFHQHDLKRPALKPTQPEGIGHEVPFVIPM